MVNFCQLVHQCVRDKHGRLGVLRWLLLYCLIVWILALQQPGCEFSQCFVMFSRWVLCALCHAVPPPMVILCVARDTKDDCDSLQAVLRSTNIIRGHSGSCGEVTRTRRVKAGSSVIFAGRCSFTVQFSVFFSISNCPYHNQPRATKYTNHSHVVGKINVDMCNIKITMDPYSLASDRSFVVGVVPQQSYANGV